MSLQHSHDTTSFKQSLKEIVLICDGVSSPANIGGLFRISDALGVKKIYFGSQKIQLDSSRLKRTSRNTHTLIPFVDAVDSVSTINSYIGLGFKALALEATTKSISLTNFTTNTNEPLLLIIGNEKNGVSEEVLKVIENHVHIDMYGNNSSMNVVQAAAIALHYLTKF